MGHIFYLYNNKFDQLLFFIVYVEYIFQNEYENFYFIF